VSEDDDDDEEEEGKGMVIGEECEEEREEEEARYWALHITLVVLLGAGGHFVRSAMTALQPLLQVATYITYLHFTFIPTLH
jgi:hypothetical protein